MQITTTLNRIKRFEDCDPVVNALRTKLGKQYSEDTPIPFSTILDTCGLAYAILCCRAEPQYFEVWYQYAVDCLNTVRHLMGSRSYDVLDVARCNYLGLEAKHIPDLNSRAFGAAHGAYLTALCKRMDNKASDDERKKACAEESVAIGVLALTQNKIDVAVEAVIEVAEPMKLASIINHFRRVVDAGWMPLMVNTATLMKAEPSGLRVGQDPASLVTQPKSCEPHLQLLHLPYPDTTFNDETVVKNWQFIFDWLLKKRPTREIADTRVRKQGPYYPCAKAIIKSGGVVCHSEFEIDDKTTKEELLAEVTARIMGAPKIVRGGCINWSESERIFIDKRSHPHFTTTKYPHIETYNCIAYYPKDTTKEALIAHAATIAATWCPSVRVVWSVEEEIWPNIE